MNTEFLIISQAKNITTIALNRTDKCNAMHGPLVAELLHALEKIAEDEDTKI
jgi:enoyl-CoA hydratase/carnithine racemase